MEKSAKKPHAVCLPFPPQGHLNSMLKLAKLLHHEGFHITFVHTEYNYRRIQRSRGPDSLKGSSTFNFETIPDGLPPPAEDDDDGATQDLSELSLSISKNCYAPFLDLLRELNNRASMADDHFPHVSCIISDGFMSFTLEAAEQMGIPNVLFWPFSAFTSMCFLHFHEVHELFFKQIKDENDFKNEYMDKTIDWIPGIKNIRLRDYPIDIWDFNYRKDDSVEYFKVLRPSAEKASALIINTFETLESDVLKSIYSMVDHVYTIGPIHLLIEDVQKGDDDHTTEFIPSNLWKEDDNCIEWLNSKKQGSVVYINFGSIAVMTEDQLVEFAWGIANSMQNFLWIIRPDLVTGSGPVELPPEFVEATKDRGMLSTWCNQELVLKHPSVGVFLTHCGWNSTLESLCAGVPMICWPFYFDQHTNCLCSCTHWGVGVEMDCNNVDRAKLEMVIRELMEGDKRQEMKKKVLEWKNKAEEAVRPSIGSSYKNLDKMIEEVLLHPKTESFV